MRADKPLRVFSSNTKQSLLDPEPIRLLRRRDKPIQRFVSPEFPLARAARSFSCYRILMRADTPCTVFASKYQPTLA